MTHHRAKRGVAILAGALSAALLACSLSFGGSSEDATPSGGGGNVNPDAGRVPTVRIIAPASGAQVPPNQRVDITVETDSTATSFMLSANGRVAGSKAMPDGQSGPTTAILTWEPDREGDYQIEVVAFNGTSASPPALLTVQVTRAAASAVTSGTAGCTGRVLVSGLNFRDGPSTGATRLGQFTTGETVTVVGRNADTSWYKIQRLDGQQSWVINNVQWILIEGQCAAIPVTP